MYKSQIRMYIQATIPTAFKAAPTRIAFHSIPDLF
jgi:hypothetical protein